MRAQISIGLLVGVLVGAGLVNAAGPADDETMRRATMQELLTAMRDVLPLSTSEKRFAAPENEERIGAALDVLAGHSVVLAFHTYAEDPGSHFLGRSLALDAIEIRRRFRAGQVGSARRGVLRMTETCVTCHTRKPGVDRSALKTDFGSDKDYQALEPLERARLLRATRRFDEALDVYDAFFASGTKHAIDLDDALREYLVLSLRVKADAVRPVKALEQLRTRPEASPRFRSDLAFWLKDLGALAKDITATPSLSTARRLVKDADAVSKGPGDGQALVKYIVASGMLHRLVANPTMPDEARAEAYLLIVQTDFQVEKAYPVVLAENYLKAAIRTAPHTTVAQEAHERLTRVTKASWGVTDLEKAPAKVRRELAELHRIAH